MKIAVLTSSRADYSIYFPLLKKLKEDSFFDLNIIAFGTHISKQHGYTLQNIQDDGFDVKNVVSSIPSDDSPRAVSISMGDTLMKFADIWANEAFNLVIALGDRYEMFSAVSSAVPFNLPIAHIHGGETTLGAIDNVFRHSISLMSSFHFVTTNKYRDKIIELTGCVEKVFNVGALSIDNLRNLQLLSKEEFKREFNINLNLPTILITFHPETVSFEKNEIFVSELISALEEIENYQFVITMPNADTMGTLIRNKLTDFINSNTSAIGVESFGTVGYLSCMKHCEFMLGNTSSGFVEASFFPKYVINLGDRQKGRLVTENIINCSIEKFDIMRAVEKIKKHSPLDKIKTYGEGNAAERIIKILKRLK